MDRKAKILHSRYRHVITSKFWHYKSSIGLSYKIEFRLKIVLVGLVAGLISSIAMSALIVMVEKVIPVPAGAFYLVLMLTITEAPIYSIYMIVAGLALHFAAGSLIGIFMVLPLLLRNDNKGKESRILDKYAPLYGLSFGFALWLILFLPITYFMIVPALNNIKDSPMITQQDPTGRVAFLVIGDVLSIQNRIVIGALAFNMFYGLVAAIIIYSLYHRYLTNKDKDSTQRVPVPDS
jgi:hypothetical protein